jgi:hypothetical protein
MIQITARLTTIIPTKNRGLMTGYDMQTMALRRQHARPQHYFTMPPVLYYCASDYQRKYDEVNIPRVLCVYIGPTA